MSDIAAPADLKAATALLKRYATLAGQAEQVELERNTAIAAANQAADKKLVPLRLKLAAIAKAAELWFMPVRGDLLSGKSKSVTIGGCKIGTKFSRSALEFAHGDDEAAVAVLRKHAWAKPYVRVTYAPERVEIKKALEEGWHAEKLADLGFSKRGGADEFFVERIAQGGTIA